MKRVALGLLIGLVLVLTGFLGGRAFQHARSGYRHEVRAEKGYQFPLGPVRWSYVSESVGSSLLDPGTTVLTLGNRTIYKAKRNFQESVPFADNIVIADNSIGWDDGELRFRLTVEPMHSPNKVER